MERLHYQVEFADNGVIVKDTDSKVLEVFQEKESEQNAYVETERYREYTRRAICEGIAHTIADLLLDGSEDLQIKDKFNIKIEIR